MNRPVSSGSLSRSAIGRASGRLSRALGGSTSLLTAGRFLRRQLWAWPILAALILGLAGWWVDRSVENALRDSRSAELNAIVDANVEALRIWMAEERHIAEMMAQDETLLVETGKLLAIPPDSTRALLESESQAAIRRRLTEKLPTGQYAGYFVVASGGVILAADHETAIGKALAGYRKEIFDRAMAERSVISKPFRSTLLLPDAKGELRANLPSMFVAAAIGDSKRPIAALGLRIRPEDTFTKILATAHLGETGETYAFDNKGLMLSSSRFDEEMKQMGLLVDSPECQSILTIELRNPGTNMFEGGRPALRRAEQPLTHLAADAIQGRDGVDADGHEDYRGVPSVGAWRWLKDYDLGVATEMDLSEALRPAIILRRALWVLMSLLILAAVGIFLAMLLIARQQKALQQATLTAKQLGQYSLEDKLGSGGMGTVYKARHAMLRRPTAVKLLNVEKISDAAIARFEREVQLTAGLTHPNTIAVFDYGRTPEGIFYYAMEYLEGINLDDLIRRYGPMSEARTLHLLRQICGSLAEAHAAGLVHRDIKPANVFLTVRGGVHDFVKVLDFGLAKTAERGDANVTTGNAITGTPLYLSPEAINSPDQVNAASDVYAIGAVAYFLFTGSPVFNGETVMDICLKHVQHEPAPPRTPNGQSLSAGFESLVLRCLSKGQSARPGHAGEVLRELEILAVGESWSPAAAKTWWDNHNSSPDLTTTAVKSTPSVDATMAYDPAKLA